MRRHSFNWFSILTAGLLLAWTAAAQTSQRVTGALQFTSIDFPGAVRTMGDGISPGGEIVGHFTDTAGTEHGFLLSSGQFTSIDYPGAIYTDARGISPGGDVVGIFKNAPGDPPNWHGYLLSRVTGTFTEVQVPGYLGTIAQRITPSGDIYGCSHDYDFGANMRGYVRSSDGNYSVLDIPSTMSNGATPDGNIVAGLFNDLSTGLSHGYVIANGDFKPFDVPGSNWTQAWDINPKAEVVGQFRDTTGKFHGFLLSGGAFTTIDPPGAVAASAVGINSAGLMVGWYTDSSGKTHAFVGSAPK